MSSMFCFLLSYFSGEIGEVFFLLMCMVLLYIVQCFLFFFAHLSGKQKCLLSVGGSAKEFKKKKKHAYF